MDKYILSLILTSILAPALGYFLAKWKLRDELAAMKDKAPYEVLTNALKQREAVITDLVRNRNAEERASDQERQQERVQLVEVLTKVAGAMDAIKDELVEHRREERERVAAIHNRLNEIQKDLWATRGGSGNGGQQRA